MKARVLGWLDGVGSKTFEMNFEVEPQSYQISPVNQLKAIVADEELTVSKGEVSVIRIKTIETPENTIVSPLIGVSHANGFVTDVIECGFPSKVEDEKCIDHAIFVPTETGEVKEGDLLGILKVNFVRTGLLSRILPFKKKIEVGTETVTANLTWREDGIFYREGVKASFSGYMESRTCVLKPVIADERVKVKEGSIFQVKIRDFRVSAGSVVAPCSLNANAYVSLINVFGVGKTRRFEEERDYSSAVVAGFEDGVVEKGDLLGVVCLVGGGDEGEEEVQISRRSGRGVIKSLQKFRSSFLKMRMLSEWRVLVANESRKVRRGKVEVIEIKPVKVPESTIVNPLGIMRHAFGTSLGGFVEDYDLTKQKSVDRVLFLPVMDGEIKSGQILGVFNLLRFEGKV